MNGDLAHRLGAVLTGAAGVLWLVAEVRAWRQRRTVLRRYEAVAGLADTEVARRGGRSLRRLCGGAEGRLGGGAEGRLCGAAVPDRTGRAGDTAGVDRTAGPGPAHRKGGPTRAASEPGTCETKAAGPAAAVRSAGRRWLPVVGVVSAGYALVGGVLGGALGLVAGGAVWYWQRRPMPVEDFDAACAERQLPLAADLLAACIAAGADPVTAARVVGECLGGPVAERLAWGAAEIRLGGAPADAWQRLELLPGAGPLARVLERAGDSGAPASAPVARLAAEARAEWGRAATARTRRAGVLITAPVGLCFLPAFIVIGVLPVVIGLAGGLLSGGGR